MMTIALLSCQTGPKVRIYLSDPSQEGMEFYDQNTGEKGFVKYSDTEKFVCMTPQDTATLLNYCKAKK